MQKWCGFSVLDELVTLITQHGFNRFYRHLVDIDFPRFAFGQTEMKKLFIRAGHLSLTCHAMHSDFDLLQRAILLMAGLISVAFVGDVGGMVCGILLVCFLAGIEAGATHM